MPHSMSPDGAPCSTACPPTGSRDASSPGPGSQAPSVLPLKSAKRRAAEALLQRRYSSPALGGAPAADGGDATSPAKRRRVEPVRPAVHVPACSDCSCDSVGCEGAAQAARWCAADVSLPPMDWPAVLCTPVRDGDLPCDPHTECYQLPGALLQPSPPGL